jgi:hypothetical protein
VPSTKRSSRDGRRIQQPSKGQRPRPPQACFRPRRGPRPCRPSTSGSMRIDAGSWPKATAIIAPPGGFHPVSELAGEGCARLHQERRWRLEDRSPEARRDRHDGARRHAVLILTISNEVAWALSPDIAPVIRSFRTSRSPSFSRADAYSARRRTTFTKSRTGAARPSTSRRSSARRSSRLSPIGRVEPPRWRPFATAATSSTSALRRRPGRIRGGRCAMPCRYGRTRHRRIVERAHVGRR